MMEIESGLFDHIVLQRNRRGVCDARVTGKASAEGTVLVTITAKGRTVPGFARKLAGRTRAGRLDVRLRGLPAGGPYDITLSAGTDSATVRDVLVGDVWLLGGQSNMEGWGLLSHAARPDPLVRACYLDDRWATARDPIHTFGACLDPVYVRLRGGRPAAPDTITGTGPGVAFGREMLRLTGVPQGLIPCAVKSSSMSQWDPALKKEGGNSLYGAMMRRFRKSGGHVAGLLWYQGCQDATAEAAPLYTDRMAAFVRALRRDTRTPGLPVAMVQIGRTLWRRTPESAVPWNSIQDQQRRLPETVRRVTVVPANDLALEDGIHLGGGAQQVLGKRLAVAMNALLRSRKDGLPPIAISRIACGHDHLSLARVTVEFGNVAGALRAAGRPSGFDAGASLPGGHVYDVRLAGKRAIVRTDIPLLDIAKYSLWYGPGGNPYCNITDGAGRPLPSFGPVSLAGEPAALTPFFRRLRVSRFLPLEGSIARLACPSPGFVPSSGTTQGKPDRRHPKRDTRHPTPYTDLSFAERIFPGDFCDLHADIARLGEQDHVVYLASAFKCSTAMKLRLLMGYDGPCKVWVDRRAVFCDPRGANPALPTDKARIPFQAAAGRHEIVIALGTNHGTTWGVYLRLQRTDVSPRRIAAGPGAYALPELIEAPGTESRLPRRPSAAQKT